VPLGPSMANVAVRLVSAAQRRRIAVLDVTPDMANVIDLGILLKLYRNNQIVHLSLTCVSMMAERRASDGMSVLPIIRADSAFRSLLRRRLHSPALRHLVIVYMRYS
jgi:hypothetical protein